MVGELLVGGLRRWLAARAPAFFAAGLLAVAACGNGEGRKRAVECQTTDDCDASTLGVCDTVSCEENRCVLDTPAGRSSLRRFGSVDR